MQKPWPFLALIILLAGCVESGANATANLPTSHTDPLFLTLSGRVTDEEQQPVSGFLITLVEAQVYQVSDGSGRFSFPEVHEGTYTLAAQHPNFTQSAQTVNVTGVDGGEVAVNVSVVRLPEFVPHNLTIPFRGQYECAAEYFIITGHCGILWEYTTCAAQSCQEDPVFSQTYQFPLDVLPRWETIVAELTWTAAASNGLGGMRMYVENTNVTEQAGHSVKVARAQGDEQPLYIRIDRGTIRPEAETYNGTTQQAFIPDEGGMQQIRVFPMGQGYDVTSQACLPSFGCFLGLGAGAGVDFEVLVTIFYNEAAPADFTARPG